VEDVESQACQDQETSKQKPLYTFSHSEEIANGWVTKLDSNYGRSITPEP
jgi:hypothetical protein